MPRRVDFGLCIPSVFLRYSFGIPSVFLRYDIGMSSEFHLSKKRGVYMLCVCKLKIQVNCMGNGY